MSRHAFDLTAYESRIERARTVRYFGSVSQVIGLVVESRGPLVAVGDLCHIEHERQSAVIPAEVVGFRNERVLLMPIEDVQGVSAGSRVVSTGMPLSVGVGEGLLGRVINPLGKPLDNRGPLMCEARRSLHAQPPNPLERERISQPISTGIRAIDGLLTCGKGQRMGIFSASGVGKSTLLGMIARHTSADVNVIALVGERGREVRDFLERDLGPEGLARSIVVVATSETSAVMRLTCVLAATTIAEYFRDRGNDVVLMMDSVTRFATAGREVGLAIGEPPATKGYPPSVFARLPKVLERAGRSSRGSITGFYTILVEGDDMDEPIADAVRAILDGHVVLSRKLANKGQYPAIDVLESISRLSADLTDEEQRVRVQQFKNVLATYREAEDLISIGAYVEGSNPKIDFARKMIDRINGYLRQDVREHSSLQESRAQLEALFRGA